MAAWSRNSCLGPAEITPFVLLVLSKNGGPSVGPRFHLFVSDVNERNEETVWVQNFLAWPQGWNETSESFLVEINLYNKKWLINCSYNPHKNNIGSHLNVITKTLDTYYGKYENVVFLGDFNAGIEETTMKSFCESYNLTNLIKQPTCF